MCIRDRFNPAISSVEQGFQPAIFSDSVPKIWPHRVNSIPRLLYLLNDFNGFECDVYYRTDSNYFDVGHMPEETIGLSLEKYFELPGTAIKYFWIDFKNLDTANVDKAILLLKRLDLIYKIKKRIIIESTAPLPLKKIAAEGFFTSYYFPPFSPAIFKSIEAYRDSINKQIYPEIHAISQSSINMDIITPVLPGITKLSWDFSRWATIGNRQPIEKMYKRKDIKIILVEIPNIYYR
jgi:hypothetical protein